MFLGQSAKISNVSTCKNSHPTVISRAHTLRALHQHPVSIYVYASVDDLYPSCEHEMCMAVVCSVDRCDQ